MTEVSENLYGSLGEGGGNPWRVKQPLTEQ